MKIELIVKNRLGITQEVLSKLADYSLDLAAVEVIAEYIYLDVPALTAQNFEAVSSGLRDVAGVKAIRHIDLLPNEQRYLHLDTLLSTLPDPVFAIDADGLILSANSAASTPLSLKKHSLVGRHIETILEGDSSFWRRVEHPASHPREVTLAGQPYLLELKLIHPQSSRVAVGSMLILQAPTRLGHHLSKVFMGVVGGFDTIAGHSSALLQVKERAQRFAAINAPLLIQGETGTGKELFARAVHQVGPWHSAAFLALNCAALPENLIESELFGYASGAFSGASRGGKPGLLELADGGTIFLDEIGEMSTYVQAKLLRFIQDGTFRRVGGKDERSVKVRIICATHRDLEQLVQEKLFREDLMYRLNVLNIMLPALRERREDIAHLAALFVDRAASQIGCKPPVLSREAKDVLTAHHWPGNVRQLENALFRTVALTEGKTITPEELFTAGIDASEDVDSGKIESWKSAQANFERELLTRLYKHYPSTRKLAKRLEVSHTTISEKLRAYKIRENN